MLQMRRIYAWLKPVSLLVQDAVSIKGSTIKMLGAEAKQKWQQIGKNIIFQLSDEKPWNYAYLLKARIKNIMT